MSSKAQQVLREALRLPPKARADIAGTLLHSLDTQDADVEAAWNAELERRIKQVENGEVKLVPWDQSRRRLRAALKRGRKKT
jgi:putative addiction module component (TIGR02574 family)